MTLHTTDTHQDPLTTMGHAHRDQQRPFLTSLPAKRAQVTFLESTGHSVELFIIASGKGMGLIVFIGHVLKWLTMFRSKATLLALLRTANTPSLAARCCYMLNTTNNISSNSRIPRQCQHDLSHQSSVADPIASGSGYLAGLAGTQVVHAAETLFCVVHSSLHLPWWAAIVATTFTLRALTTSPLAVHQAKMAARAELLLPTVRELQEAVKHRVVTQCRREGVAVEEANRRMMKEVRRVACDSE